MHRTCHTDAMKAAPSSGQRQIYVQYITISSAAQAVKRGKCRKACSISHTVLHASFLHRIFSTGAALLLARRIRVTPSRAPCFGEKSRGAAPDLFAGAALPLAWRIRDTPSRACLAPAENLAVQHRIFFAGAALLLARRIRDTPSFTRLALAKNLAGRWD